MTGVQKDTVSGWKVSLSEASKALQCDPDEELIFSGDKTNVSPFVQELLHAMLEPVPVGTAKTTITPRPESSPQASKVHFYMHMTLSHYMHIYMHAICDTV